MKLGELVVGGRRGEEKGEKVDVCWGDTGTVPVQYQRYGGPGTLWCGERDGGEGVTTKSVTGDSHDAFPLKMSQNSSKGKSMGKGFLSHHVERLCLWAG